MRKRITQALLRALAGRLRERRAAYLFLRLAERFHVEEALVRGELGRVQGKLDDRFVFGRYLRSGSWSPNLTSFLTRCFGGGRGGTFVDVGANLGLVTIPVARLGNVDCKCFEPEPENLALLRGNLERNCPAGSYEIFPIALFREETTLDFEISTDNRGDHRIRSGPEGGADAAYHEDGRRVISVPARRLDQVLDPGTLRRPLVIKSDAQGADLHVYAGGAAIFARADAVVLEFWPYGLGRTGSPPEALAERLEKDFDLGLVVRGKRDVREDAFVPIAAVAAELRRFCRDAAPRDHVDVVAVKRTLALSGAAASAGTSSDVPSP